MKQILVAVLILGCVVLQAAVAQQNILSENFDGTWSNNAPVGWSNERIASSPNDWTQATGGHLGHPTTAHSGSYNAFLYDESLTPYQTRLITPVMDLEPLMYSNAVVTYWLAQKDWWSDQDYSYVYYRTSAISPWTPVLGGSFTTSIGTWTKITLTLPNISDSYQLAFVGETRWGYGVCIDDVSVDAAFALIPVNTVEASPNGTILPNNPMVIYGSDLELEIIPDDQYRIKDVLVNGESVGPVDSVRLEMITEPQTVLADFTHVDVAFTPVNTLTNPDGVILPNNPMVLLGSDQEFEIIPKEHYRVLDVAVNGESLGPVKSILLEDIMAPQTIAADFARVFVDNDFNGDDITDLCVYYPMSGTWHIKNTSGSMTKQFGWADAVPVSGDYDGDGLTDFAVYWPDGGRWFILRSTTGFFNIMDWGWSAAIPVPADYDGDGAINVAVYVPSSGKWYIQDPNGKTRIETLGSATQIPVPADYDGDGEVDIGVYDMDSGDWSIIRSSNLMPLTFELGGTGAMPVPGDYDGNGQAEPAVYSPTSGTWAFVPGTIPGPSEINWGWSAAVPVPADYDGDGSIDIAVYVRSTGSWYILLDDQEIRTYSFGWSAAGPATPAYQTLKWFGLVP